MGRDSRLTGTTGSDLLLVASSAAPPPPGYMNEQVSSGAEYRFFIGEVEKVGTDMDGGEYCCWKAEGSPSPAAAGAKSVAGLLDGERASLKLSGEARGSWLPIIVARGARWRCIGERAWASGEGEDFWRRCWKEEQHEVEAGIEREPVVDVGFRAPQLRRVRARSARQTVV